MTDTASPDRRGLLRATGAAAVLGGAVLASSAPVAAAPTDAHRRSRPGRTWRVDTHHHVAPPSLISWAVERGLLPPDPEQWDRWARWDLDSTLETMNANQIALGVASAPAPTFLFEDRAMAVEAVRVINDGLATLAREHPSRFGFFAYLPLPHVDLCLAEIGRALDELGADGVMAMTHTGQTPQTARYLGDPTFEPVLAELDRRRAVLFTHPDSLPGERDTVVPGVRNWVAEFMLATTRTALSLISSGTLERHPHLSVILSHAGGFLPFLADRMALAGDIGDGPDPRTVRAAVRRFYYDTAQPISPHSTPTLLATVDPDHILYGTDYAQTPAAQVAELTRALDRDRELRGVDRRGIGRDNALRLLPTLSRRLTEA